MVAKRPSVPARGDIAWISLDPTRGHEQRGRRPVLVLSPEAYNRKIGLALVCPITSTAKGYVFEVPVTVKNKPSVVLCDHVRSVDWQGRDVERIERAPQSVVETVQENVRKLIFEE